MSAHCSVLSVSVFLLSLLSVSALSLKISLQPDFTTLQQHLLGAAAENGSCTDAVPVDCSNLTLYGNLRNLGPHVKFWRSASARANLALFQSMRVPGLRGEETTVGDVFKVLRQGHCYPFFLGGSVRDQFLNRVPNDADVEVDCSMAAFLKLCMQKWGRGNCAGSVTGHVAHVGNTTALPEGDRDLEVMDVGSTISTFYVPLYSLEYTVNAMAYDTNGNDVIIDLTGTGSRDACAKHIRIPSLDDSMTSWQKWLENTTGVLFRFWKLRSKGLVAFNPATREFIVKNAKKEMQDSPQSFAAFYCHYVFGGGYDREANRCSVQPEKCEKALANAILYERVMSEDFGEFWGQKVVPNYLPNLEDCTEQAIHLRSKQ